MNEFFWRRLHSFAGFVFLLFVIEHLFTNSLAALYLGENGEGFVRAVNFIQSLPYLHVLEVTLIAVPLAIHTIYGIERIRVAKCNSIRTDGSQPSLPSYPRNHAFTWQRITSVVLIVGIALHVYYMRFDRIPEKSGDSFVVTLSQDRGLAERAKKLEVVLTAKNDREVIATASSMGAAFWMVLRDTYKSLLLCLAYSAFVVTTVFHACNGLWTFAITWGISLSEKSQIYLRYAANGLMCLLIFFGFAAIWGVYWITLGY